jgi:hypothetical protein
MAGAKQLDDTDLSWYRPRPYVQQWCARGTVLRRTVVLEEGGGGGYKRDGRGGRASRSQRFLIEASANIAVKVESVQVSAIRRPPAVRGLPLFL